MPERVEGLSAVPTVRPVAPVASAAVGAARDEASGDMSFAATLQQALATTNALQLEAGRQAELLAAGLIDDVHSVTIAAERANLALQLTVAVRNKALEAYQEIMRMQV